MTRRDEFTRLAERIAATVEGSCHEERLFAALDRMVELWQALRRERRSLCKQLGTVARAACAAQAEIAESHLDRLRRAYLGIVEETTREVGR